ncbi:IniB N-terminal domain-containing protein [Mycobacterium sp.]|uniref:IniB N-terminal domain-containing protein n=1 Tax=Mycobacterium sp. TaxID=1785 RepID=UPI002DA0D5E6|nr:IniB N-terminal domain-containing protein [Mycobacterium sp.]
MSILDFTTGLFREPASLQSFVDDPEQALRDAGLPDVTPEQVHDLLPVVAESMPADHPLQTVVHAPDPVAALLDLDIAQLAAAARDHSRADTPEKAVGEPAREVISVGNIECKPVDDESDFAAKWDIITEGDTALGGVVDDPLTPEIEGDLAAHPAGPAQDLVDTDFSPAAWGKAIE